MNIFGLISCRSEVHCPNHSNVSCPNHYTTWTLWHKIDLWYLSGTYRLIKSQVCPIFVPKFQQNRTNHSSAWQNAIESKIYISHFVWYKRSNWKFWSHWFKGRAEYKNRGALTPPHLNTALFKGQIQIRSIFKFRPLASDNKRSEGALCIHHWAGTLIPRVATGHRMFYVTCQSVSQCLIYVAASNVLTLSFLIKLLQIRTNSFVTFFAPKGRYTRFRLVIATTARGWRTENFAVP